ncbi:MAG: hypothetical protein AD742_08150 [Methylibium sp. NZG]|nr:MAG: hypothetical protein AD742_08150 [Methylibium sp. NZG]
MAVQTAPVKPASAARSEAALRADTLFWKTLHDGDYDGIPRAMQAVKGAYLQTPGDAVTAAHVGFLHIWRLAESARQESLLPSITDDAVLARKFFQEAVALHPGEARYQGFLASSMLAEAAIHKDEKLTRQGYFTMLDAIDAWPEFNLFTAGYVMSPQPAESARFKEGLAWQWRTLDECVGATVDRRNPAFDSYMKLATQTGPNRVCWNSWIAPHNFEGFFMNMGDMLVKAGDWQTAQKIYANAKLSPDYAQWKFNGVLEDRIARAEANVAAFNLPGRNKAAGDNVVMNHTRFACAGCHQK